MMRFVPSLAGRLTLWYANVFGLCFLAVFGAFYVLMSNHFHRWTDAELKGDVVEINMAYRENAIPGVLQQLRHEGGSGGGRFLGRLIDSKGRVVYEMGSGRLTQVPVDDQKLAKARARPQDPKVLDLEDDYAVRVIYSVLPDGHVVQIGLTLLEHERWMRQFSRDLLKVALLALVLSVTAGGLMARRALSPIRKMAQTATEISGRSMGRRMPVSGRGDEVDRLAKSFNGMLDRNDTLVEGLRDVTVGLAHDLRTPITGTRGMVEVTLSAKRGPGEYRRALYQVMEQLDRLLNLFNTIFDVAETESGTIELRLERVSIDELANEIAQTFGPVASSRGIFLEASIGSGAAAMGDRTRLSQVLANLIDNALKHTPRGGRIRFCIERDSSGNEVHITVSDTGSGISEKDMPHIFERYYRGGRSRSGPGAGLGLPLVQGIVKAHCGRVTVESQPGKGTVFRVYLPCAPGPTGPASSPGPGPGVSTQKGL